MKLASFENCLAAIEIHPEHEKIMMPSRKSRHPIDYAPDLNTSVPTSPFPGSFAHTCMAILEMGKSKLLISWIASSSTVKNHSLQFSLKNVSLLILTSEYSYLISCLIRPFKEKHYTTIMRGLTDSSNNIVKTLQGTCMLQSWPAQYSSKSDMIASMEPRWENPNQDLSALELATFLLEKTIPCLQPFTVHH